MGQYWEGAVYEQPSEDKIRANAADTVRKEKKKGKNLALVMITGRNIVKEWWRKCWRTRTDPAQGLFSRTII